ncbi:LysM peptidoglycan-binding domain-containing protein [Aneurinibacillus uraniidurans]|uniref:LysM peptidoglycan-binding domain-containing protein n=1 Tax=Aneurinibacillus uraniidurans TaxID=2966586 RepID=UPI002348F079|nr:LysM peptidoglycan-binding domain-containing protein [Aneurinibacillus sp. B1]WCN38535.1 LysM peptidoglycan-binding domain-containing protein [Aneurinibacillus sp. B1]
MQNNRESVLAFPVQHSIFIPQDQNEIEQIDEIELTPHIQIEEVVDEVIISGYLKLEGTYAGRPPKFPDIPQNESGVPLTGYVDSVVFNPFAMDPNDFPSESETTPFEQKIPVHIRIARDKISAMDDLYATISAFDYEIQSARKLMITAELALNGIRQVITRQPKTETEAIPTSFEYTLPVQDTEEEKSWAQQQGEIEEVALEDEAVPVPEIELVAAEESTEETIEELQVASDPDPVLQMEPVSAEMIQPPVQEEEEAIEEKQEIVPEPISFTPQPAPEPIQETALEIKVNPEPDRAEAIADVSPELVKEVKQEQDEVKPVSDNKIAVQREEEQARKEKEIGEKKPEPASKVEPEPKTELEPKAERDPELNENSEREVEREPEPELEVNEEPEEAKVSITLKGTKRDPVTVTTGLLSSVAEAAEAEKRAEEVQAIENAASEQEIEVQTAEEKKARAVREDALYLTNFMNKTEETFTRLKMCIAQKDETLEEIAERYSITAAEVAEANGLHTNTTVARGQVLYIPVRR